jgi:hypothetical protein
MDGSPDAKEQQQKPSDEVSVDTKSPTLYLDEGRIVRRLLSSLGIGTAPLTVNYDSLMKDLREQIRLLEQAKKEGNLKSLGELCSIFDLLVGLMDVSAREKNMLERKRTDYENCPKAVNGIKDSWGDNQTVQLALQESCIFGMKSVLR